MADSFFSKVKDIFLARKKTLTPKASSLTLRTAEKLKRIDPTELEIIYARDPIVFNGINTIAQTFASTKYSIVAANKRDQRIVDEFLKRTRFKNIMYKVILHTCIYGNAWLELIYANDAQGRKHLYLLDWIDPKVMDFYKDYQGRILYDKDQQPKAYVQYIDFNIPPESLKGKKIVMQAGKRGIYIPRERIAHFAIHTVGDNPHGIGLIEPIYNIVKISMNIEEGLGQSIYRRGFPIIVARVGDERHEPTQEQIDNVADNLKDVSFKNEFVFPYYYDVQILESKYSFKMEMYLKYFNDMKIAALGLPRAFVTGSGAETNKAVLEKQNLLFERRIKQLQDEISQTFINKVFARMAELENFSNVPKFVWEDINIESMNAKAERLKTYVDSNLLVPDKTIRNIIRRAERLPEEGQEEPEA